MMHSKINLNTSWYWFRNLFIIKPSDSDHDFYLLTPNSNVTDTAETRAEDETGNNPNVVRGHSLSTYAKFYEKLTVLTPWYAHVRTFFTKKSSCYKKTPKNNGSVDFALHWLVS